MKTLTLFFISAFLLSACSRPAKDLATVEIGMTKAEVIGIVGEPQKTNVINRTEIWGYPDSSRTVVFRMDTVYSIMTTAKARLDSINVWMDSTNNKMKDGFKKIGAEIENVGDKIDDKLKRDSN